MSDCQSPYRHREPSKREDNAVPDSWGTLPRPPGLLVKGAGAPHPRESYTRFKGWATGSTLFLSPIRIRKNAGRGDSEFVTEQSPSYRRQLTFTLDHTSVTHIGRQPKGIIHQIEGSCRNQTDFLCGLSPCPYQWTTDPAGEKAELHRHC